MTREEELAFAALDGLAPFLPAAVGPLVPILTRLGRAAVESGDDGAELEAMALALEQKGQALAKARWG